MKEPKIVKFTFGADTIEGQLVKVYGNTVMLNIISDSGNYYKPGQTAKFSKNFFNEKFEKDTTTVKYFMQGAFNQGIDIHPQKHLENLGIKVYTYGGDSMWDYILAEVENLPDNLPSYIEIVKP